VSLLDRIGASPETLMERAVGDSRTILDVGCGANSPLRRFRHTYDRTVGVDLFAPALAESAAAGIHGEYRQLDVLKLDDAFEAGSFDAVVAFDLVEHLSEDDATVLFGLMERTARKRVVVHTPNGFMPQTEYDENPLQVHRSGWSPRRMRELGYIVRGSNGLRFLRGEQGRARWRPEWFWGVLSRFTQPLAYRIPELAYQLLCVKEVGPSATGGSSSTRS
jgi:SAM-dependent methyltransferase